MVSKAVKVNLTEDAEARPVAVLVQRASQFDSKVYVEMSDKRINAKSIMGMMSLGIGQGTELTISADGPDEAEAVENLTEYLSQSK